GGGLWLKLWKQGLRGKMWRVLRSIYKKVESCVKVDKEFSEWIVLETGVRQGCVLSPLLYALFINGLAVKLRKAKLGIPITADRRLEVLLYAEAVATTTTNIDGRGGADPNGN